MVILRKKGQAPLSLAEQMMVFINTKPAIDKVPDIVTPSRKKRTGTGYTSKEAALQRLRDNLASCTAQPARACGGCSSFGGQKGR